MVGVEGAGQGSQSPFQEQLVTHSGSAQSEVVPSRQQVREGLITQRDRVELGVVSAYFGREIEIHELRGMESFSGPEHEQYGLGPTIPVEDPTGHGKQLTISYRPK